MMSNSLIEFPIVADKSFIGAWFIEDLSVCDALIEYHETNKYARRGHVMFQDGSQIIKPEVKDSYDSQLLFHLDVTQRYVKELEHVQSYYIDQYPTCRFGAKWRIEAVNVQKYLPNGGYYQWHCERQGDVFPERSRHLVYMTYLNDVDDGGETEFMYQNVKIKPRKGLTLVWPADWTHTHRGLTSPTETKYIVTGWWQYFDKNSPMLKY